MIQAKTKVKRNLKPEAFLTYIIRQDQRSKIKKIRIHIQMKSLHINNKLINKMQKKMITHLQIQNLQTRGKPKII